MSQLTSSELFSQAYQLYQNEKYAQAFDLVTREANRFPERAQTFYFWRVCLASKMNETKLALNLLKEAVEAGYWYSKIQLREDTDLAPLQGLPEFEQLVEVCTERHTVAQAQAVPMLVTLAPQGDDCQPWPLLMAIHGHNSNAEISTDPWRPITSIGWLLAFPQSSQIVGSDAYTWRDSELAKNEIQSHYTALGKQYIIDQRRVVVGGFSMGGGLAIELTLSSAIKARGFIAVGPYLPDIDRLISFVESGKGRGRRGYIIVGEQDDVCYEGSQTLAVQLIAHDFPCELEIYPNLGHDYPSDFEMVLTRALEFVLQD